MHPIGADALPRGRVHVESENDICAAVTCQEVPMHVIEGKVGNEMVRPQALTACA